MNAKSISIELNIRYHKARSAWERGVTLYADELLDNIYDNIKEDGKITEADLLNGADNWKEYSYGGCSLIKGLLSDMKCPMIEDFGITRGEYFNMIEGNIEKVLFNKNIKSDDLEDYVEY